MKNKIRKKMSGFSAVDWAEVMLIGIVVIVGVGGIIKVITQKEDE